MQLLWCVWLLAALMMSLRLAGGNAARSNAGIVDVLWAARRGRQRGAAAPCSATARRRRALLLAVLGGAVGLAPGRCICGTRVRGEPEDGRYRHLRAHWHGSQGKFFALLPVPGVADRAVLAAVPGGGAQPAARPWPWIVAGVAIWLVSVAGEALADRAAGALPRRSRPTTATPAATACGATRAIRTTSSNGCTGSPTCCSRSVRRSRGWPGPARW